MHPNVTFGRADGPFQAGDFTIIRTEHAAGLELRRHDHEAATLVIVQEGEFDETVGARSYRCTPGTVLIKPAGAHHSNRYDGGGSTAILASLPSSCSVPEVRLFRATAAMRRLAYEFGARDAASALVCEGVLLDLLRQPARVEGRSQKRPAAWLRTVEERLRSGPVVALRELAAEVGRDPVHLAREFRRHYGSSPGEYARSLRVERSCELLRRSRESLAGIALDAGFYDQSHFTNVFRRVVGITPAEYRRRTAHQSSKTVAITNS